MRNPVLVTQATLAELNAQVARDHEQRLYRPTAVGILHRYTGDIENGQQEVLFVQSAKNSNWSFVRGGVEEGEDVVQALFREVREEVGIESVLIGDCRFCRRSEMVRPLTELHSPFTRGRSYYYFRLFCVGRPTVKPQPTEIKDYAWVSIWNVEQFICDHERKRIERCVEMIWGWRSATVK